MLHVTRPVQKLVSNSLLKSTRHFVSSFMSRAAATKNIPKANRPVAPSERGPVGPVYGRSYVTSHD